MIFQHSLFAKIKLTHIVAKIVFHPVYLKVGASTGPLLAGTTLGLIIEAELTSDERFFSMGGVEEHFRWV